MHARVHVSTPSCHHLGLLTTRTGTSASRMMFCATLPRKALPIGDTGLVGLRDVVVERLDDVDDEEVGPAVCRLAGSLLEREPARAAGVVGDGDAHDATPLTSAARARAR